jgi:hypothetical protein
LPMGAGGFGTYTPHLTHPILTPAPYQTLLGPSYPAYPSRWLVSYHAYAYGYIRYQPISKPIYYIWCSVTYELCRFGLFWDSLWATFGVWKYYALPGVTPVRALEALASFTPVPFVRALTRTICYTVTVVQTALASVLTI